MTRPVLKKVQYDDVFPPLEKKKESGMRVYGETKEKLIEEINKYTTKGYTLHNMGTEEISGETVWYATLSLHASF